MKYISIIQITIITISNILLVSCANKIKNDPIPTTEISSKHGDYTPIVLAPGQIYVGKSYSSGIQSNQYPVTNVLYIDKVDQDGRFEGKELNNESTAIHTAGKATGNKITMTHTLIAWPKIYADSTAYNSDCIRGKYYNSQYNYNKRSHGGEFYMKLDQNYSTHKFISLYEKALEEAKKQYDANLIQDRNNQIMAAKINSAQQLAMLNTLSRPPSTNQQKETYTSPPSNIYHQQALNNDTSVTQAAINNIQSGHNNLQNNLTELYKATNPQIKPLNSQNPKKYNVKDAYGNQIGTAEESPY
jgi:hypothetical protein